MKKLENQKNQIKIKKIQQIEFVGQLKIEDGINADE